MNVDVAEPPGVVKITSRAPAVPDGVTTVTDVELTLVSDVPAVPPNVTPVVPVKFVPVIVTVVEPVVGPLDGVMLVMVGATTNVNPFTSVADPPGVVNTTFTAPAVLAGVTTVTEVALTFVSEVPVAPPNVTPVVPLKLVPVIVTAVPPAVWPVDGDTVEIVGTAKYVNVELSDPPGVVNTTVADPAVPDGVTAVTEVELTFVSDVAAVPPTVTLVVALKLVPVIVTAVPPATGPLDGDTDVIVGAATNVNPFTSVAEPPAVVSTRFTGPAVLAGVTTVTEVALTFVSDVPAVPPNVTAVVLDKFVPEIVTVVPPAAGPLTGDTDVIVGVPTKV